MEKGVLFHDAIFFLTFKYRSTDGDNYGIILIFAAKI
jgi:hypothetical protein